MGIDPGVAGTGWAVFYDTGRLTDFGVINVNKKDLHWFSRSIIITNQIIVEAKFFDIKTAIIEFPQTWSNSAKSYASTTKGDIHKLAALCGSMAYALAKDIGVEIELISPQTWKGNLSKGAVMNAVKRKVGVVVKSHAADAVGIGLYHKGGDQWII